jgi:hypothetical protein
VADAAGDALSDGAVEAEALGDAVSAALVEGWGEPGRIVGAALELGSLAAGRVDSVAAGGVVALPSGVTGPFVGALPPQAATSSAVRSREATEARLMAQAYPSRAARASDTVPEGQPARLETTCDCTAVAATR